MLILPSDIGVRFRVSFSVTVMVVQLAIPPGCSLLEYRMPSINKSSLENIHCIFSRCCHDPVAGLPERSINVSVKHVKKFYNLHSRKS